MQCPKCESTSVICCEMAYEQGRTTSTTTSSGTARSTGMANSGQSVASLTGQQQIKQTHKTVSMTSFAQRASPPDDPVKSAWMILGYMLGACFLYRLCYAIPFISGSHLNGSHPWTNWFGLLVLAATAFTVYNLWRTYQNRPQYREEYQRWLKSWICAACGHIFVPESRKAE